MKRSVILVVKWPICASYI